MKKTILLLPLCATLCAFGALAEKKKEFSLKEHCFLTNNNNGIVALKEPVTKESIKALNKVYPNLNDPKRIEHLLVATEFGLSIKSEEPVASFLIELLKTNVSKEKAHQFLKAPLLSDDKQKMAHLISEFLNKLPSENG